MLQNKRAYMSHSIRGKLGVAATPESMKVNNEKAHEAAVLLRCVLPEISVYVPGEHDQVISLLYQDGRLSEEDILWADCRIISNCDILIVWSPDGYISAGMQIELNYADEHGISRYVIHDIVELQEIKPIILKYLSEKK